MQEATPDPLSVPLKVIESGLEYQPFASGGLSGTATALGAVESYGTDAAAEVRLPAASVQLPTTLAAAASGPL